MLKLKAEVRWEKVGIKLLLSHSLCFRTEEHAQCVWCCQGNKTQCQHSQVPKDSARGSLVMMKFSGDYEVDFCRVGNCFVPWQRCFRCNPRAKSEVWGEQKGREDSFKHCKSWELPRCVLGTLTWFFVILVFISCYSRLPSALKRIMLFHNLRMAIITVLLLWKCV